MESWTEQASGSIRPGWEKQGADHRNDEDSAIVSVEGSAVLFFCAIGALPYTQCRVVPITVKCFVLLLPRMSFLFRCPRKKTGDFLFLACRRRVVGRGQARELLAHRGGFLRFYDGTYLSRCLMKVSMAFILRYQNPYNDPKILSCDYWVMPSNPLVQVCSGHCAWYNLQVRDTCRVPWSASSTKATT